ncbi:MAG: hypothetical protein ACKVS6_10110 [Planctomycetota bacterium]
MTAARRIVILVLCAALAGCMSRGDFTKFAIRHRPVPAASVSWDLYKRALEKEQYEEAEKQLRDAIDADREFVRAWRKLQDLQIATFRRAEAIAEAEAEIAKNPESPRGYYLLARVRQGTARKQILDKALDVNPFYGWARMALAMHEEAFQGDGAGLLHAAQATELLPTEPEPWLAVIQSLQSAGQFERLQTVLLRCVSMYGKSEPEFLEILIQFLSTLRRNDSIVNVFSSGDIYKHLPVILGSESAVRALAAAARRGGPRSARADFEEAAEVALAQEDLRPDHEIALCLLLAELSLQSGDITKARSHWERAYLLGERAPRILRLLRLARIITKDYAGAWDLEEALATEFEIVENGGRNPQFENVKEAAKRASENLNDRGAIAKFASAAAEYGWVDEAAELVTQAGFLGAPPQELINLQKRIVTFRRFLSRVRVELEKGVVDSLGLKAGLEPYKKLSKEILGFDALDGSRIEDYFPAGSLLDTKPGAPGLADYFDQFGLELRLGKRVGGPVEAFMMRRVAAKNINNNILGRPYSGREVIGEGTSLFTQIENVSGAFAGATLPGSVVIVLDAVADSARRIEREREAWAAEIAMGRGELWKKEYLPITTARAQRLCIDETLDTSRRLIRKALERDPSPAAPRVLELVRLHEYGHLADADQFLPIAAQVPRIISWLVSGGFSIRSIEARLEMRAELTALCTTKDPEISLASILDHCDRPLANPPHSNGFVELAHDFVREVDRRIHRGELPQIERARPILPQVWKLSPAEIRSVALALAEHEGLVQDQ